MDRSIPAVLLLAAILWASTAFGECGWVLWIQKETLSFAKGDPKQYISWEISSAYPKFEQCVAAQKTVWNNLKKLYGNKKDYPRIKDLDGTPPGYLHYSIYNENNDIVSGISHTLYCLPGTLDP